MIRDLKILESFTKYQVSLTLSSLNLFVNLVTNDNTPTVYKGMGVTYCTRFYGLTQVGEVVTEGLWVLGNNLLIYFEGLRLLPDLVEP